MQFETSTTEANIVWSSRNTDNCCSFSVFHLYFSIMMIFSLTGCTLDSSLHYLIYKSVRNVYTVYKVIKSNSLYKKKFTMVRTLTFTGYCYRQQHKATGIFWGSNQQHRSKTRFGYHQRDFPRKTFKAAFPVFKFLNFKFLNF